MPLMLILRGEEGVQSCLCVWANSALHPLTFVSFSERKVFFCADERYVADEFETPPRNRHHGQP